jgi:cephalosporin-C deacetylase-like acetyl esterase
MNRRSFLSSGLLSGSAAIAASAVPLLAQQPEAPKSAPLSPFDDPDFGFTALATLGQCFSHAADPGKLLAILATIKPGDFNSAFNAYHEAAVEARDRAQAYADKHHPVSAREAWLTAASYFSAALHFGDGTDNPDQMLPTFQQYLDSWTAAATLFDPPIERIEIPYEGTHLTGWFLRPDNSRRRRPLVILNQGADGLEISSYPRAIGALDRGYNCLLFNGPGQGDSLWIRKLYYRPDWEKVITPVVDAMVCRRDVDPKRIALVGISFAGYWVPRALAFEPRIAAAVADPGAWDVSDPWYSHLPAFVRTLLAAPKSEAARAQFDQMIKVGIASNVRTRALLRFRMRPFGMDSNYDIFRAVKEYNLVQVASRIRCPMLITDPEGEPFFPGQAQKLYDALTCPKSILHFTYAQGAGQHCEVAAPVLRNAAIHNWLDETLAAIS